MEIRLADLRGDYVKVCRLIAEYGEDVEVRGLKTRELTGVTLMLDDLLAVTLPVHVNRKVNVRLAAVEALCMIGGVWRQPLVEKVAPGYSEVLVSQSTVDADQVAYGSRIRDQLPQVFDALLSDPSSRQAVLSIWNKSDQTRAGDRPCTVSLQFLLRNGHLQCHTYMRSQDVWLGLAMDLFVFTQLQLTLAHALGVAPGRYYHHVGSLHAYDRDLDKIAALKVDAQIGSHIGSFPRGVRDPSRSLLSPYLHSSAQWFQDVYMGLARDMLDGTAVRGNEWYTSHMAAIYRG